MTTYVELVGVRKCLRITIGRANENPYARAIRDLYAIELNVDCRSPETDWYWGIVTKRLFNGAGRERRIVAKKSPLISMLEHCEEPVTNQVRRRLMPRVKRKRAGSQEFVSLLSDHPVPP